MVKVILVTTVVAIVFSGCVGTESPIGKGVIHKAHHYNVAKTVNK